MEWRASWRDHKLRVGEIEIMMNIMVILYPDILPVYVIMIMYICTSMFVDIVRCLLSVCTNMSNCIISSIYSNVLNVYTNLAYVSCPCRLAVYFYTYLVCSYFRLLLYSFLHFLVVEVEYWSGRSPLNLCFHRT